MRVVFMGTPTFSATILENLAEQHEVALVLTRADAIRGRGKKLVASPVKEMALELGIPVLEPQSLRDSSVMDKLLSVRPDCICVAAYGKILPKEILELPRFGCLNVHASLLPRWRGAAPVERAILAGDEQVGVCIMRMEEGLDTGDFCISRSIELGRMNADTATDELAHLGSQALLTALVQAEHDALRWQSQDETLVTVASKIGKGELDIAPCMSVDEADRMVRASGSSHVSRLRLCGKTATLLEARPARLSGCEDEVWSSLEPGKVRFASKRLFVGCADGALEVLAIKPEGKQEMEAKAFAAGIPGLRSGDMDWSER